MTQFQPPPSPPPGPGPIAGQPAPMMPARPKPYSGIAIAAFVLSILGCLGISAVLGFILGIVGIVQTRNGQKRGMGLAIAALPISLIMGALSVVLCILTVVSMKSIEILTTLPAYITVEGELSDENLIEFRKFCSADFNTLVSNEHIRSWVSTISDKQGKFVELDIKSQEVVPGAAGDFSISVKSKFVNGSTRITVKFVPESVWDIKLDDIIIDGSSPRDGP